jgi:hypothetical protein
VTLTSIILQLLSGNGPDRIQEKDMWQRYLEQDLGWVRNKPPRDHLNKMIKLRNWDGPNAAVVRNSRHLTAVSDGRVVDTWDCTYRPVNTYWTPA